MTDSERYWDERARENAFYFVDTDVEYDDPDAEGFWRRGEEVVDRMFALAGFEPRREEVVVDIGCGVGRLTRALAARVGHVYGVDVSREMLALARLHSPDLHNVVWLHGDGRGLGVLDASSVDGCFSHVVFQHIPDPEVTLGYIREMGRVLRPGGWALFGVSTDPEVHRKPLSRRERVARALRRRRAADGDTAWWGSAVDPGALRDAARDGNLDVERVFGEGSQYTIVLTRRQRDRPASP